MQFKLRGVSLASLSTGTGPIAYK